MVILITIETSPLGPEFLPRIARLITQLFFDSQKLIVLSNSVRPA
ncbi:uncharacterized protein METZ01_LOCUS406647, partial [marine metagenome]